MSGSPVRMKTTDVPRSPRSTTFRWQSLQTGHVADRETYRVGPYFLRRNRRTNGSPISRAATDDGSGVACT